LDDQTKELFGRVNDFIMAMMQGQEGYEVERLFDFVDNFIGDHFHQEEETLKSYSFPDLKRHMAQHEYFRRAFRTIKDTYLITGLNEDLLRKVHLNIVSWLIAHVSKTDKEWAEYIKNSPSYIKPPDR